ncbi:MAG: single-stranded DNA-binding protein [bacterium]|nr:single-stranded DNA-binding protein [bacterium]
MLNRVVLIGRLTRDPELRYTPQGVQVCSFDLAVDRPRVGDEGKKEVDFIPVITWRKLAEACNAHLGKGRLVAVDGRLQIRSYEIRDGGKRRVAEVIAQDVRFLGKPAPSPAQSPEQGPGSFGQEVEGSDDDLPF